MADSLEREEIIRTESNNLDVSGREREGVSGRQRESISGRQRESVSGRQRESVSGSEEEQIDEQRMLKGLESSYEANKEKLVTDIKDFIKKKDKTIDDIDISIEVDEESQVDKLKRCPSQQSPQQSLVESPQQSLVESPPQSLASLATLPAYHDPVTISDDITLDQDCLNMIDDIYLDCQKNLRKFFDSSNIDTINRGLKSQKFADGTFLQIEINTGAPGKFLLEINMCTSDRAGNIIKEFECVHFSLFTRIENGALTIRGLHFTLPHNIINRSNKRYSHLYIGHKLAENCLCKIYAANTFIIIILKSIGTYFDKQMSISNPDEPAKPSVINFIRLLRLTSGERKAIGQLLIDLGEKYKVYFEALVPASGAASGAACGPASVAACGAPSGSPSGGAGRGGMKIMKYNKVVEKSNSKDGKNTLVNNKELKINKIKDKIKILKQDKIKNKDKIIKQIKLIEDIKTKIKIEKEKAKQKHKEKASVSKTPKTTTTKPKTTTAKPKTTTAKPKTPKTPKTTTTKPKTPKTTTTKPKTPKTTTTKPKTTAEKPRTPKTTTTKPKTTKRQVNK